MRTPTLVQPLLSTFFCAVLVGCVDSVFVPGAGTHDADIPVWIAEDRATILFRREYEALEFTSGPMIMKQLADGTITPSNAELVLTERFLMVEQLRLEVLRGPNGPALASEEQRKWEESAFLHPEPDAELWRRSVTLANLIAKSEKQIEYYISDIADRRRSSRRPLHSAQETLGILDVETAPVPADPAHLAQSWDSCGDGETGPRVLPGRPALLDVRELHEYVDVVGQGSQTSGHEALHRMSVKTGSTNRDVD